MAVRTDENTALTPTGKAIRVVVTLLVFGLLGAGTVLGADDDFPFGPFRMYATARGDDTPVESTRLEAIDTAGRRFALRGEAIGLRRAEIEGQLGRLKRDPDLLAAVATAYDNRHPGGPELARIEIIVREFALTDGRPNGDYTDTVAVTWSAR